MMDHLTLLRSKGETAPAAFEDSLLKSAPQFSYDLLVAVMTHEQVSIHLEPKQRMQEELVEGNEGIVCYGILPPSYRSDRPV